MDTRKINSRPAILTSSNAFTVLPFLETKEVSLLARTSKSYQKIIKYLLKSPVLENNFFKPQVIYSIKQNARKLLDEKVICHSGTDTHTLTMLLKQFMDGNIQKKTLIQLEKLEIKGSGAKNRFYKKSQDAFNFVGEMLNGISKCHNAPNHWITLVFFVLLIVIFILVVLYSGVLAGIGWIDSKRSDQAAKST